MIDIAEETLGIRHPEFSSGDTLLMPAFSLLTTPANLTIYLHSCQEAPLPPRKARFPSSVDYLAPFILSAEFLPPNRRVYLGELLRTL